MKKKLLIFGAVLLCLPISYLAFVHSLMTKAAQQEPPNDIAHVIVLGAKLNGDVMSLSLYYRVREALHYLEDNPKAKVIVSGGQGEGEWITEASAMATYFIENGIEENRIILEELSTTTFENFKFSRGKIGEEIKEVVVVTNDFHLYRAMVIARRQGFEPYPLAAETPRVVREKLWTREYVAILKTWIFDR
ncbi:YdcF family protein [Anaerobacillus isosaccharinicus]|uniref:YdcF family protein n=1 Tax=Anaerobacillus isosaccharinicus TaxID=1532552 RepID=A0A1S2LAJ0_9BACI|nr:YdcF family protein [Anaerobacillus isosaccharinicus]MBA5588120.1 YdcF family protein [Anaerobacillus isosaccharinicus]QOY38423.1 YdcF family protein [Anaerobacillus isosaccharinicus]